MFTTVLILGILILLCGYGLSFHAGGGTSYNDFLSLRGLLALVIVTDHLSQEMTDPGIILAFSFTGYIVVSIFFAISGFGLAYSVDTKPNYLDRFLAERLPKILIPFWLINLIYIFVEAVIYRKKIGLKLFLGYTLGYPQVNTNAWYVLALTAMYLIFNVSVKWLCHGNVKKAIPWIIVFIGFWDYFCLTVIKKYWWMNACFAFPMGMLMYRRIQAAPGKVSRITIIPAILFLASFRGGWQFLPTGAGMSLFCMIIASVTVSILFFAITNVLHIRGKSLAFFGSISYELYLIHNLFRHLFKSDIILIQNDVLYFASVLGCSIAIALLFHVKQYIPDNRCKKKAL